MKWSPDVLGDLFFDDIDHNGLLYWFKVIEKKIEEDRKYKILVLKGLGYKDAS